MSNILKFVPKPRTEYVKISRNGERFWLEHVEERKGGTCIGLVANSVLEPHPYAALGTSIEYQRNEVIERFLK